jgi:hypothetical protein
MDGMSTYQQNWDNCAIREAQIHQVGCKLDTLQKKKQTNIHQLESSLENLTNKL